MNGEGVKQMKLFRSSKRIVNIMIDDYIIRLIENNGEDLKSIKRIEEKYMPEGIIENGKLVDEVRFYNEVEKVVKEWNLKKRHIRFNAPQSLIIMREIELPEDVEEDEIKDYIYLEIGNSIHFPFENPVIDLYGAPTEDNKVTIIAAPEEEIMKYVDVFHDCGLEPKAVEVLPLANYRYFKKTHLQTHGDNHYLFVDFNLTNVSFSIFSQDRLKFHRHQIFNVSLSDWRHQEGFPMKWQFVGDSEQLQLSVKQQLGEISRLMDFFEFSMTKGEAKINHIVLLGDYPQLEEIKNTLEEQLDLPVNILQTNGIGAKKITIPLSFIPVLGIAIKGGK